MVEFSARFIKPVIVPAGSDVMLSVTGKVVEVANGQAKVELTALCDEIKVLGMAKGVIKL